MQILARRPVFLKFLLLLLVGLSDWSKDVPKLTSQTHTLQGHLANTQALRWVTLQFCSILPESLKSRLLCYSQLIDVVFKWLLINNVKRWGFSILLLLYRQLSIRFIKFLEIFDWSKIYCVLVTSKNEAMMKWNSHKGFKLSVLMGC